jgi:hypothetical protein
MTEQANTNIEGTLDKFILEIEHVDDAVNSVQRQTAR